MSSRRRFLPRVLTVCLKRIAFALAVGALSLASPRGANAQHASLCGDAEKRDWLRFKIQPLMLSADSATAAERQEFRLPLIHPDSIHYIDDERICARAAKVYYRNRPGPQPIRGVSVARVGDMWVVYGDNRAGEWTIMEIYNRDFVLVAGRAV